MANPARAYLATQVETTSQGELLIMLYDAAIKFLKRAKIEIENKDYAKKGVYISKAMAIIHELVESLNREKGGDITPQLLSLYQFCTSQLIKANIRMDTKRLDDVIKILDGIRSAYAQIVSQEQGKNMTAEAPTQAQDSLPPVPQAPPILPEAVPQQKAYAPPKSTMQTSPSAQQQEKFSKQNTQAAPAAQKENAPATEPKKTTQPVPPPPTSPLKLRTAYSAAKFRAANAYTNNT